MNSKVSSPVNPLAFLWSDPQSPKSARLAALSAYLFALLLGLAISGYMFPNKMVFAKDIRVRPVYQYDAAMEVYGQRYFTRDAWRWPLFHVPKLGYPEGTNVAFMDGVPLAELVVKIFRSVLPPDFHSVCVWLALCWIMQPVAAVFALRSAGERRVFPSIAIAIISVSMPALLMRFVHSALCSHFFILIALGLYFSILRAPRLSTLIAAAALIVASLLVNPYIMEMVIAVLVAAPLTLLARRDRAWLSVAIFITAGIAITAALALLLGYGHAIPMSGFGVYSMNLLAPIYPQPASPQVSLGGGYDATGGQYEGQQYLGMGVILLLLLSDFTLNVQDRLTLLRRHAGLVFSCLVLTFLALSTKIYAGQRLLLDLPTPSFLLELRGSGRLFWPVAYALILAGVVIVCRNLPARWAAVALLLFATVQFVETMPVRRQIRHTLRTRPGYTVDTTLLRSLLADHSMLTVWPKFACGADPRAPEFSQLYLLASEVAIPVSMTYVGRLTQPPDCVLPRVPISVADKELLVFVPQWNAGMVASVSDWQDICRQSGPLVVCAQDLRRHANLPVASIPAAPLDKWLATTTDGPGAPWLASGWYGSEDWGTWANGSRAYLVANVDKSLHGPLVLQVRATGVAGHPATVQKVTVHANGQPVATWDVTEGAQTEYDATIPAPSQPSSTVIVEFAVEHPIIPQQQHRGADPRNLGFGVYAFRLAEAGTSSVSHPPVH